MHVKLPDLTRALRLAREIEEQYRLVEIAGDDPCRSVDGLISTCAVYLETTVQLRQVHIDRSNSAIYSACIIRPNKRHDILYAQGLDASWIRFVVCKELFHVVLDCAEYRNMDLAAHVEAVTLAFPDDESKPSRSIAAEFLAEIAAMEFLFPMARRKQEIEKNDGLSVSDVAARYRIPVILADRYLGKSFMLNLGDL